jgi:hypothetical protein
MKPFDRISESIKTYPYKRRIPWAATVIIGGIIFAAQSGRPVSVVDMVIIGALILNVLCGPSGRPFWFFGGLAIGATLVYELQKLHSVPWH